MLRFYSLAWLVMAGVVLLNGGEHADLQFNLLMSGIFLVGAEVRDARS
ncbi:MAG: hypothetical protein K2X54_31720 [Methylobacterium organophilum]|nr:hypothetical protein [Methylobacterium organophilum]